MTKNLRLDRETLSLFPLSQLKIQSYRVSMLYLKISLCQIYLAISSLVRVSMWCPASKTICGEVDVWSLLHLDLKKTNSWNREVARSSSCCSLQQVYPPGNARKFTYLGRWDELGETEGGWEGQSPNCHHSSHSGLVLLLSSLSLLLSILLFLPRYGVISCKALLSRCGNFIFAMNLHSPSPCSSSILLSTRPLSSVLSLCTFACARVLSLSPGSSPFQKFTLNAQFHLHRPRPSTASYPCPKSEHVASPRIHCANDVSSLRPTLWLKFLSQSVIVEHSWNVCNCVEHLYTNNTSNWRIRCNKLNRNINLSLIF